MRAKNFSGINERKLLGQIGQFGEKIASTLFCGEISSEDNGHPFADVTNLEARLAIEVKMVNGRHTFRVLPKQIEALYDETSTNSSFLFDKGVFVCIFYGGVHKTVKKLGKSKLWSRKYSKSDRYKIIASDLQYIYVIDVKVLKYLIDHHPELIKRGAIVSSAGKSGREQSLCLNRTFFKRFFEDRLVGNVLLNRALGFRKAQIFQRNLTVRFVFNTEVYSRLLPVYYIGSKGTAFGVKQLLEQSRLIVGFSNVKIFS